MLLVALIVALGIKSVGTLLMGALVIIPAIAAKNFTNSIKGYTTAASIMGLVSLVSGILLAGSLALPPGPIVILISAGIFLTTLVFKK